MVRRRQRLGVDEVVGQLRVALQLAPHLDGVVDHLFLGPCAVLLQHLAGVGIGEHRFDPAGDVPGIKRDRPSRGDRGQQRVADTVFADRVAHFFVHVAHVARGEELLRIEQRKGALFLCQRRRGEIGRPRDGLQPALRLCGCLVRPIAQTGHQQGVREPRDAKADPPLGLRLGQLLGQREFRDVHHVVHHPHRSGDQIGQRPLVQRSLRSEGIRDQPGQVDRPQKAGAIGRQGLFAAGVGGGDGLNIIQVVGRVDTVDEDHTRLGVIVGRPHDPVPQVPCLQGTVDLAVKHQFPWTVGFDCRHESIGHQHREVEHAQTGGIGLGGDERLDIRVIAAHGRHHGPPARSGGHDGAAHGVPDIHEGQGARGIRSHARYRCALGANGREVIADAAALLHRQRSLFQHLEDAAHAVGDGAHDEAVEQCHLPGCSGPGGDAAGGKKLEVLQRGIETVFPGLRISLDPRHVARDSPPGVLDTAIDRRAIRLLEAVFHVPDLFCDGSGEAGHGSACLTSGRGSASLSDHRPPVQIATIP